MKKIGKLYLVSVGPGFAELIPPLAERALRESDVVVGYELYLKWIHDWVQGKEIHTPPMTRERERGLMAVEFARQGRVVSLVSSGDVGVYAMAAVALEAMSEDDQFEVQVVPGITAANSCASLLGSPLSHDFATLSLSDLLCPREWIDQRARHLAASDMVTVLYNVQSRDRHDDVYRVLRIFLEHKKPDTWCGVVRNAYREGQRVETCRLSELLTREFDMFTSIIVGNRFTQRKRQWLYTPRGYGGWSGSDEAQAMTSSERPCVWVFSGTSDGNALARQIAEAGHPVVVSVASDYGRKVVAESCPNLRVRAGRMGAEARRRELAATRAQAVVDATHPFATEISRQIIGLSDELKIPYFRYERPQLALDAAAARCADMAAAAQAAMRLGTRIFLATGAKDLAVFLNSDGADQRQWFARVTPDSGSVESALRAGIPSARLCAMQGPFPVEFNQTLWRSWKIDCVVTKDSGAAGGFEAKQDAARALGIPLVVVERPAMNYPVVWHDFAAILGALAPLKDLK